MIERRYFDNRRELERRQNSAAAIAFHFSEIERRQSERRACDSQAICAWLSLFDAARSVQADL